MATGPRRNLQNWIALFAAMVIALYLCWLMVRPFVGVLLWAGVLAIVAHPLMPKLRARKWGPSSAAAIATLTTILVLLIPIAIVGFALARQAVPAAQAVQEGLHKVLDPNTRLGARVAEYVDVSVLSDPQFLAERAKAVSGSVARGTVGVIGGAVGALINTFFTVFTLFFFLRDGDGMLLKMRGALPLERKQADDIFKRTHEVITASLYGMVVIGAVQAVLAGVALWALGIRAALLWGVVTFFASMVPMLGTQLVLIPATIYLLLSGDWIRALILLAWGVAVVGMVDNFLRPRVVGERTRLHELVVLFSALGGIEVFGVLGLIIGPVVAAVTISLLEVVRCADVDPAVKVEVENVVTTAPAQPE